MPIELFLSSNPDVCLTIFRIANEEELRSPSGRLWDHHPLWCCCSATAKRASGDGREHAVADLQENIIV